MADKESIINHHDSGQTNGHYAVGDTVTFRFKDTLKKGVVQIVDKNGTYDCPGIPSYDIYVESENMLYKHVSCDFIVPFQEE